VTPAATSRLKFQHGSKAEHLRVFQGLPGKAGERVCGAAAGAHDELKVRLKGPPGPHLVLIDGSDQTFDYDIDDAAEIHRRLLALSERLTLGPGEGLPGRVLVTGEPSWIVDTAVDRNFPRADAARREGLQAAFGFPLRSPKGIVGVMEFFTRELREPDERLLQTMNVLGSQVGQFVARRHAEVEVRASESRMRAMLDAALDAVVTMDHRGRVLGWNHAAETALGYRADEAVGRDMADLIVPPALRAAHRKGLARFLETEQPVLLDRRLELTAMHKNGAEFPVELTITRIGLPGPATFTGYLRDITDRKQADEELRASRARLVEVADAERRRIQRNLHDGAQQRLTAVLLSLGRLRESPDVNSELLELAIDELAAGLQEIRELAGGLHPSVLSERVAEGIPGGRVCR